MADPKKSVQEFAQAIKAKYPQYKDIDDYTLAKKVVAKYPQYADAVEFDEKKKASGEPSEESASAPQSTLPKTLADTRPSVAPIQEVEEVDEFAKTVVDRKAEAKKANFETSGSIATPKAPAAGPVLQANTVAALSQYAKENKDKKFTPQETEVLERAFKNSADLIDKDLRDARMEPFRDERVKRFQNTFDNTFGIGVPVYAGASLIRPYVSDDVKDMIDDVRTAYRRNSGITEESDNRTWLDDFRQGAYEDGAKKLGLDVADAIGMSAAIAATATPQPGMLTASAPAASSLGRMVYENIKKNVQANPIGAVSMAVQGALDKAEELEDNVYMTEAQKAAAITAAGATSVLTESLFSTGDQIIEPYKGMAKNTFKEVIKDWGKASLKAGGEESLESNIEIVGNALTDAAINGTVPKVNPDDLIMATVTSFIAPQLNIAQSYSPAALSTGLQAMRGPAAKQENIETFNNEVQNLKKIKQELKRTDLPEAELKALQAAKSRHENNIKAARNEFIQFTETFSEEDQNEVINIMNRIGHLDDEFKKTKSQVLRDEMAAEASDLLSRKAAIEDKYKQQADAIQEQAAGQVPVQPEAEAGGEVAQGESQAEPQVATQEGVTEEVQVDTPAVDVTATETVEEAPVAEEAPAPKVEKTQEELDLEAQEQQVRALEDDIQIEKDNFVERKAEIAEQIKEARANKKLPAPERRELIEDLKAELEDAKNESNAIIGQYREEAKALKKDVGKAKAKLQKKVQQKAPKAAVEPIAQASPSSPASLTAKELLFLSDDNPRSSKTIFSNILNKILYSDKFKSDRSRLAFVRKYVDPGFTYSVENKRVPMSERLGYLLSDEAFDISKDDYQAFERAVSNLGIDIDSVANDVTASLVENDVLGDYVDRVTAKKIASQQKALAATADTTIEAPAVQPFARPGVYSPAYIKTKLAEAYKKLPTKKFVELFNKNVDSGLTEDIAKTSIGRDGYVNLFNSDDYVKFFKDAGVELAKEEAPEKKAEPRRTELEIARDAHERAKRDFLRKSGLASGAQLQALPEFIRLLRSYVRLGIATAKEAYARYKQEFPGVSISEDRFNSVFESAKRLEEKKKIREEASAESLAKRNAKMQERKARTEEAARKAKEDKAERDKVKQEEKEQKKLIDSAMDGYINAILESGDAKTIAAAFKNFQEVAGKLDKTEFVQQLRRTIAKLKEDKHISTVSAGNLNRILRTIERVSPATYALEVDRAMNAVKKEINAQLRKQLNTNRKKALKNIQSGRIGNSTIKPLFQRVLSIDASMIPDESFDDYIAIVTRLGAKQAVLPLADRRAMETTLNNILDNIDAEAGRLIELGEMYNDFVSSNNLDEESYSKVLDKMKSEGLITDKEREMMKRYKSIILSEAKVASAGKRAESPEARAALEEELSNIDINVSALENRDDRAIATAIQDNLDAASEMTSQDIRKLLLVVDNINKGFLPHMGEVVRRKLVSINDGKKLASALNKVSLPIGEKIIVNVKGALMRLMGRKATDTGAVRLAAERNPAAFIDEVFGNFKTTPIYDTLIRPMASAFSRFQRDFDVAVNKLNTAEAQLYKSKATDNEFRSSMYKIQMYLIQREYETNVGNPEVRPAVEWIKATIDAIEEGKLYNEATAAELREQLTKFSEDGQVSTEKIEKSLTPAEKGLVKAIDEVNNSIKDKAVHVSDVIRGEGIEARDNYVHIQVFNDGNSNPLKEIDAFTERYTASTKAKSLITRTGKVNPINLDPYQTAVRGLKMTLLDYHMTPAIKQVNGTLAASKDMVNQKQNLTAVESLMQGFNEGVLSNAVGSSMSPDITDTLVTNGYRAVLASVRRAIAETASNITFALANPAQFTAGVKSYYKLDNDISAGDVLRNVGSVHTTRLFGGETLTSPMVEKSGFRNTGGVKTEMQPDVINKMARISKIGRRATNKIADIADTLMSTPDAMVSRPIWFGAFENSFKELTGREPDLKKISDNDEAYMEANRDAIKKASKEADKQVTQAAASNNPYETIAKLRVNEKDTSSKKIYKAVNGFISRFAIFEYNTARRAIYAMIGNGSISRKEGAALLTGVAMRSIVYVMASSYIGGVMSALAQSILAKLDLFGLDEEEEEEDLMEAILPNADTLPKLYRSIGGALANIFVNRNFGNVIKNINGLLIETANEEYGQFLRNGESYDPYENNLLMNQLSSLMTPGNSNEKIASFVAAFAGPLSPVARTFISTFNLTNRALNNKTAASRKENLDKLKIRVPLEFAGNLGLIPVYNDVRKATMDVLYDDIKKEEAFRQDIKKLINQYPNGGDKFEKEIDKTFSKYTRFKTRQAINKQKELLEDN